MSCRSPGLTVWGTGAGALSGVVAASEGAVRLRTETAAVEQLTRGVRVDSVHPWVVATAMIQELLDEQGDDPRSSRERNSSPAPAARSACPARVRA